MSYCSLSRAAGRGPRPASPCSRSPILGIEKLARQLRILHWQALCFKENLSFSCLIYKRTTASGSGTTAESEALQFRLFSQYSIVHLQY